MRARPAAPLAPHHRPSSTAPGRQLQHPPHNIYALRQPQGRWSRPNSTLPPRSATFS